MAAVATMDILGARPRAQLKSTPREPTWVQLELCPLLPGPGKDPPRMINIYLRFFQPSV
jgi:hypothetical protein